MAWAWLGQRPGGWQAAGLAIGFAGVLGLGWNKASLTAGEHGISPALGVLACLAATLCYGYAANYTRQRLHGVPPLAVAAGSQLAATLLMLPLALWAWPATLPSGRAWAAVVVLALVCTGFAYLLFFRLIAHVGPARAITVTYLIPVFAIGWAALMLAEQPTSAMFAGCAVVLLGTALATGVIGPRRRPG